MKVHDVEQRSPEWFALRLGVPTASEFHKAITPKQGKASAQAEGFAAKLALEMFWHEVNEDFMGSDDTVRGTALEANALAAYQMINDVEVQTVGFITDDKGRGCSPDGLVGDDGSLEIKCLKDANHVLALVNYHRSGEFDPKYIPQTQGQMLICQRPWCDLMFYSPELPPLIIRQCVDEKYAGNLDKALDSIIETRDFALSILRGSNDAQEAA